MSKKLGYKRLGILASNKDSAKWAALLESAYRCAKWRWTKDDGTNRTEYPRASRIEELIENMRTATDDYATGGLKVVAEDGARVLYVHSKLAEAPDGNAE